MGNLIQIAGSIASIGAIPLAIYLFLVDREKKAEKAKNEIVENIYSSIMHNKTISSFEINSIISSISRERKIGDKKVSPNFVIEDLVNKIHKEEVLSKQRKINAIESLEQTYLIINNNERLTQQENSVERSKSIKSSRLPAKNILGLYIMILIAFFAGLTPFLTISLNSETGYSHPVTIRAKEIMDTTQVVKMDSLTILKPPLDSIQGYKRRIDSLRNILDSRKQKNEHLNKTQLDSVITINKNKGYEDGFKRGENLHFESNFNPFIYLFILSIVLSVLALVIHLIMKKIYHKKRIRKNIKIIKNEA